MNDRNTIQRLLTVAATCSVLSICAGAYIYNTNSIVDEYNRSVEEAKNLQKEADSLKQQNDILLATIEEANSELASFSEDKIALINEASSLSEQCNVSINKLTVSDVWQEGQTHGMTVDIEVVGDLKDIYNFYSNYCSSTNRVISVSARPSERFPWVQRDLDGNQILSWFDLTAEQEAYIPNVITGSGEDIFTPSTAEPETISLNELFADKEFKVYFHLDFLGRQ